MSLQHNSAGFWLGFAIAMLCTPLSYAQWQQHDFKSGDFNAKYAVFKPNNASSERKPVLLYLHGAGERGTKLEQVLAVGIPMLVKTVDNAIIVAPQIPEGRWWSDKDIQTYTLQMLERVITEYSGDRTRLYLVGVSMGGHGAIHLSAANPATFAGVIAICARIKRPSYLKRVVQIVANTNTLARALVDTPIWLFHGDKDRVVPVRNSRSLNRALTRAGARARYTEIVGGKHNIWDQVLGGGLASAWLLEQRRHKDMQMDLAND